MYGLAGVWGTVAILRGSRPGQPGLLLCLLTARNLVQYSSQRTLNSELHLSLENNSMATNATPELSNVFPQSSFFQERRAPALPSPTEIRALHEASGNYRAASLNHPSC